MSEYNFKENKLTAFGIFIRFALFTGLIVALSLWIAK